MKKFFFFAIAVLGMMTGCRKAEMDPVKNQVDDSDRVAVQFAVDAPSLTITKTKGAGAVEEWAGAEHPLYILGYERAATTYALDAATTLIPNIVADAPADATVGGIEVVHPDGDVNAAGESIATEPYYYADNKVYDFYGYYVDDAAGQNTLAADANGASITLKIDGTQDIMAAKADPGLDVVAGVAERNAYSAYAARRGVHPTLTFEHMLTRFNFHAVAGAASGKNVTIEKVTLDSYDDVTLTVAPVPALAKVAEDTKETLELTGVTSASAYVNDPESYEYDYAALLETGDAEIGNSIMVVAGETSHTITLTTKLKEGKQDIAPLTIPLNAADVVTADGKPVEKFEAGYQYDIILTVYGPEEVKITAVLTEWKDGGNTVIDPDKWFEEETEPSAAVSAVSETSTTFTVNVPTTAVAVQAGYSAAADVEPTTWVSATQTRALDSWTVEMTDLTADTDYYLHVRYANEAVTESTVFETLAPVEFKACAPIQNLVYGYVYDKETYNTYLWDAYLVNYPYNAFKDQITDFPWLVLTLSEVGDAETYTIEFKCNGETMSLDKEILDTPGYFTVSENKLVVEGGAIKYGLTLKADYFPDFTEFTPGTYSVVVTYGNKTYTASTVVPATEE